MKGANTNFPKLLTEARKTLVYIVGAAGELATLGLLHGTAAHYLTVGLLIATGLGIYGVKNVTASAKPSA